MQFPLSVQYVLYSTGSRTKDDGESRPRLDEGGACDVLGQRDLGEVNIRWKGGRENWMKSIDIDIEIHIGIDAGGRMGGRKEIET